MSTTPHHPVAGRIWLRVLVLAFVLLLPAAHGSAHVGSGFAVPSETVTAEYDVLESAPRPPSRHTQRPATAAPPAAPVTYSPPPAATGRPLPAPARLRPPYVPDILRSVVLRC